MAVEAAGPQAWRVLQVREGERVQVGEVEPSSVRPTKDSVVLRSLPELLSEEAPPSKGVFEEIVYTDRALPELLRSVAVSDKPREAWPGSEVRTLVDQGPTANRINLSIVGDGYTEADREKFFADARRITDDLFGESTFKSYLPLFNVHAVFVPSRESGLTDGDNEKDTALGLYRDPAGSKRAIMPGDRRAIERAIDLAPATDYPILVANDDYYGGLGGRYAITTRSPQSGSMVLRHELGHNFGNVGEEYDGGYVYSGANHSDSSDVPWKHWASGTVPVFDGKALMGDYPWKNLKDGPLDYRFNIPAHPADRPVVLQMDVSSVGWETPEDVSILLDGQPVEVKGQYTDDRSFFRIQTSGDLAAGRHTLQVRENVHDGDNVLALIRVNQYDGSYDFRPDVIGAFPSFDAWEGHAGYRPTHESCLMRDMRTKEFCPVDRENMWHQFLNRVTLVDNVSVGDEFGGPDGNRKYVELHTPSLSGLDVRWYRVDEQGVETEEPLLAGQTRWNPTAEQSGKFRVRVTYATLEVRNADERFTSTQDFTIGVCRP